MCQTLLTPTPLRRGDTIAIISPATTVKSEYIVGAVEEITRRGYKAKVMPYASGPAAGSYASAEASREDDFCAAYADSEVRAILCSRGGYGAVHFIDKISEEMLRRDPKWLIGFSDISALHAMMLRAGVRSLHASMARHLAEYPNDAASNRLFGILEGELEYSIIGAADSRNIAGVAEGELRGGNLAVLDGLGGTPFDLLMPRENEDVILFIEDIGEAIYRTERMVRRLALCGALSCYKGIVVGRFTESRPDANYSSTADMLRERLPQWGAIGIPIAFDMPIGHIDGNMPVIEGARVRLTVTPDSSELDFIAD